MAAEPWTPFAWEADGSQWQHAQWLVYPEYVVCKPEGSTDSSTDREEWQGIEVDWESAVYNIEEEDLSHGPSRRMSRQVSVPCFLGKLSAYNNNEAEEKLADKEYEECGIGSGLQRADENFSIPAVGLSTAIYTPSPQGADETDENFSLPAVGLSAAIYTPCLNT